MAHYVKCVNCGQTFNRDKVPCIKQENGKRYFHVVCPSPDEPTKIEKPIEEKIEEEVPKELTPKEIEELERKDLFDYIQMLFGKANCNFPLIAKQIKNYRELYGYTYTGIKGTLHWYYVIKGNDLQTNRQGVGIVPYNYEAASRYWRLLSLTAEINKEKVAKKMFNSSVEVVKIKSPRLEYQPNLFDLGDGDN